MRKKMKIWRAQIRQNANPGRSYCRTYYPGKEDGHTMGRLVAEAEWKYIKGGSKSGQA